MPSNHDITRLRETVLWQEGIPKSQPGKYHPRQHGRQFILGITNALIISGGTGTITEQMWNGTSLVSTGVVTNVISPFGAVPATALVGCSYGAGIYVITATGC